MIIAAVITAGLFCTVLFTACSKSSNSNSDPCSGITCNNGGTCAAGSCICPAGWTGVYCQTASTTTITYTNDTYTPISITANGSTQTIPVGSYVSYTGTTGTSITITASTSGKTSGGAVIGTIRSWTSTNTFPASGTLNIDLDVSADIFYLEIQNNDPTYAVQGVYVNYGSPYQTFDNNFSIPNNGSIYGVGYYQAITSNEIYFLSYPAGTSWTAYPAFPVTLNQKKIITIP